MMVALSRCMTMLVVATCLSFASWALDNASTLFVPHSIEEALRELRHTQATGTDWANFGSFSSATLRNHGHSDADGDFDEQFTMILERKADTTIVLGNYFKEGIVDSPEQLDKPELDISRARYVSTEKIPIGRKQYTAKVYEFVDEAELSKSHITTTHKYWLAAGIPTGVARHEAYQVESSGIEKPSADGSSRLTDIDVAIIAAGRVWHCYCYESEARLVEGEREKRRTCKNSTVPGGIVRIEGKKYIDDRETAYSVKELVDFEDTNVTAKLPDKLQELLGCHFFGLEWNNEGLRKELAGDHQGAIKLLDLLLSLDDTCAQAYNNRGIAKMSLGDRKGALEDYGKAIDLFPKYAAPYQNRGLLEGMAGNFESALSDLNKALVLNPQFAEALANRAAVNMFLFRDKESLKDYMAALKLNPHLRTELDKEIERARRNRRR